MKPAHIEFVEPRAWKVVWAGAAVVILLVVAVTGSELWSLHQKRSALELQIAALEEAQRLQNEQNAAATVPKASPRSASEAMAAKLLLRDWNRLYDVIESVERPGARLVGLSFDSATGQAGLEYELESMALAAGVGRALNDASGKPGTWLLERVEVTSPVATDGKSMVKGIWRSVLD